MCAVDESVIQRLEALRPSLKREWEALLRTEPTLSPLGNPDTLIYLMDETLSDLLKLLRAQVQRHTHRSPRTLRVPLQRHCACGMNPLLNYYATGEIALHFVTAPVLTAEHDLDDALGCYHVLALKELEMLCAVCQFNHGNTDAVESARPPDNSGR